MMKEEKTHTTNYFDTFIEVAEDTITDAGKIPTTMKDKPTVAELQFEMISSHPYRYTSDEVLFTVYAMRNGISKAEWNTARKLFFSKGQACFRASPLTKNYGFGVHFDGDGKMALYAMESATYQKFIEDSKIQKVKAMRSKRK